MRENLVSIVIPIYNVEEFLRECLETVINQTYKNLEIILSDDGSTDGCPQICDEYQKRDNRIKVIHKKNGGLSDARNAGIEIATGQYISFIDSDDFIELDMIEYLYHLIQVVDADFSCCQRKNINENGIEIPNTAVYSNNVIRGNDECMKGFFMNPGIDTVAWGKLYRIDLFKTIRYPYGKYHEDVYTTYKVIAESNCISIGFEKKYYYRLRKVSISNSSFKMRHLDAIEANIERSRFIMKNYPELKIYANAGIIYATNQCVLKLSKHKGDIFENGECFSKKKIVRKLQGLYRRYEGDFLKSQSGILAKIFSVFAYINLGMMVKLIGIINNTDSEIVWLL